MSLQYMAGRYRNSNLGKGRTAKGLPQYDLGVGHCPLPKQSASTSPQICAQQNLHPQSGISSILDVSGIAVSIAKLGDPNHYREITDQLRGWTVLIRALSQTSSLESLMATLTLYYKNYLSFAGLQEVFDYLKQDFLHPQGSDSEPEMYNSLENRQSWIDVLKNIELDWKTAKKNKFFAHVAKLMGLAVSLEICKASDITFSLGKYALIAPNIVHKFEGATDIFDALFSAFVYFVEVGSFCIQEKSLRPLLFDDPENFKLDEEYCELLTCWKLVEAGNLLKVKNITDQEFLSRCEKLATNLKRVTANLSGYDRKLVMDKRLKVVSLINQYTTLKLGTGARRSPFLFELFGESSQGKSTVCDQLLEGLLRSAGLSTSPEHRSYLNAGDKFMSTVRSDTVAIIIDDMCNDKSEFVERSPTRFVVDLQNNMPFYANMAAVELKGQVVVEPAIMAITTNVKDLDARVYSNCPYSIQRRPHCVITVKVRPEFAMRDPSGQECGVDSAKVDSHYARNPERVFDDIWIFDVERAVVPTKITARAEYGYIVQGDKQMKGIDFVTLLNWLIDEFHEHTRVQTAILSRKQVRGNNMRVCGVDGCRQIGGYCLKHVCSPTIDLCSIESSVVSPSTVTNPLSDITGSHPTDESSTTSLFAWWRELRAREDACKPVESSDSEEQDRTYNEFRLAQDLHDFRTGNYDRADFSPHFGEKLLSTAESIGNRFLGVFCNKAERVASSVENYATLALLKLSYDLWRKWDYLNFLPTTWVMNEYVVQVLIAFNFDRLSRMWSMGTLCNAASLLVCLYLYVVKGETFLGYLPVCLMFLISLYVQKCMATVVEASFRRELLKRNTISIALTRTREDHIKYMCKAAASIAILYGVAKLYKAYRMEPQSLLEPATPNEIKARDTQVNVWAQTPIKPLSVASSISGSTVSQLTSKVKSNLLNAQMKCVGLDKELFANVLMLKTGLCLLPTHYFSTCETFQVKFTRGCLQETGENFTCYITKEKSFQIPATDISVCHITRGGSFASLVEYFPISDFGVVDFTILNKNFNGEVSVAQGSGYYGETGHSLAKFKGVRYRSLSQNTFNGMCGSPLISDHKPIILGIHLGGQAGTPHGCAGTITSMQISNAISVLEQNRSILITASDGRFDPHMHGTQILIGGEAHFKSPIKFMPTGSQIKYHGPCVGRTTFKSDAKVTLISGHVLDVMGLPNVFCPPQTRPAWKGYQAALSSLSSPSEEYPPSVIDWACEDYERPLIELISSPLWVKNVQPLTDIENMNGIPGTKFIDRIPLNTAYGFPHTGPKSKFVVEIDPFGDYSKVVVPDSTFQEDIDNLLSAWSRGERGYPIAKACKKDEVLTKDKVRIFYANLAAFSFLIRRYYLPLIRFLELYPLKAECAVGTNPLGPDWEHVHTHVTKFGEHRMIGGDYSKYDQKLSSQLLFAALNILNHLAEAAGYTQRDLVIMRNLAADLVYSVVAYNGDLISLTTGGHISGNSLTVILNSICGSLNMRCAFRAVHPELEDFRSFVSVLTYGDDNIGSVSEMAPLFDNLAIAASTAAVGQTYTSPDKSSELTAFIPFEKLEFLKRRSVFHPKLDRHLGALDTNSISKRLHMYLRPRKSPISERMACALNIDSACLEWFLHGETEYEIRRSQLREVAERAGLVELCVGLDLDYQSQCELWLADYGSAL